MSSYKTLEVGKRWLKSFPALVTTPADGITQDDLDAAEAFAFNLINEEFARHGFDVSGLESSTPPAVADIADQLASAHVWELVAVREGAAVPGAATDAGEAARDRIKRLTRSGLLDADGGRIASADSPAVMRVRNQP